MDELLRKFEQFDIRLFKVLEKVLGQNPTPEEILIFLNSQDFDDVLISLGYEDLINEYASLLDQVMFQNASGLTRIENAVEQIETLKQMKIKELLGKTNGNVNLLKTRLAESIIGGVDTRTTLNNLKQLPLTDAQLGTVITTAYTDFSRTTTAKVFENEPEQRFEYVGGVLETSSDECQWLMLNQKPGGYTKAEIDKGIETPFVHKYGDLKGQRKMIYWNGRNPNFNCIHVWQPIDE